MMKKALVVGWFILAAGPVAVWAQSSPVLSGIFAPGGIGAGREHSLAVRSNGSVAAWGLNSYGQTTVPAPNERFTTISGGELHSLGMKEGGVIFGWGRNDEGQLNVPGLNTNFVQAYAGGYHSLGLRADGSVAAWGRNTSGQTNVPSPNTDFIAIAGGRNFSLGLKGDGSVVGWGQNTYGQIAPTSGNSNFVAIAAGDWHSVGLKEDGSIVGWGRNNVGQLDVPLSNTGFIAIAAGYVHSVGLKWDGTVVAWGDNASNQCDIPSPNNGFIAIAANGYHTIGLRADGSLVAWGRNNIGQTNVPPPNAGYGLSAPALNPAQGSMNGGYPVTISGYFLPGDITNVTLAGVAASSIESLETDAITVIAGAAVGPLEGDVRAYSAFYGELILDDPYRYIGEQVITFDPIGPQITTNAVQLAAEATSGLPVVLTLTEGLALVYDTTNLVFTGAGFVSVVATQDGNDDWYPAAPVTNRFLVSKAPASITPGSLAQVYDGTPKPASALTDPIGLDVLFTYDLNPSPPVNAGSYTVAMTIDDAMYAGQTTATLTIAKATAAVELAPTNQIYTGTPLTVTATTIPAYLPVTITYMGGTNPPVNVGVYEVTGTVVHSNYAGGVTVDLVIEQAEQSISIAEIPAQFLTNTLQLTATASSGLPVSFSVATGPAVITDGTNVTFTGTGLVGISSAQGGDANWLPAPGILSFFMVEKMPQTISFPEIPDQNITNTFGLVAAASSGLPVSFSVANGPGVISSATNLTFLGTGLVQVVASQSGDDIWLPAVSITNSLRVTGGVFWLELNAGPNGSVDVTSGWKPAFTVITLTAEPSEYFVFSHWDGDVPVGDIAANPLDLLMDSSKTVTANFAEEKTSTGVPLRWLVAYGITNNFEAAVLLDHDEDGVTTGDEYIADTNPMDSASYLAVSQWKQVPSPDGPVTVVTAPVSTNRVYDLQTAPVSDITAWSGVPGRTNILPAGDSLVMTNASAAEPSGLFRLRVRKP